MSKIGRAAATLAVKTLARYGAQRFANSTDKENAINAVAQLEVDEPEDAPASDEPLVDDANEDGLDGMTVAEITAVIEGVDDPAHLDEIAELERAGKDRKGVHEAIEKRRAALTTPPADE